ncbi:hypothetical protein [Nocardia sp. NPDC003963]
MTASNGRSALATGRSRGVRAAIVRASVEADIDVVIGDLLEHAGLEPADSAGPHATFHRLDVTDERNWRRVATAGLVPNLSQPS